MNWTGEIMDGIPEILLVCQNPAPGVTRDGQTVMTYCESNFDPDVYCGSCQSIKAKKWI